MLSPDAQAALDVCQQLLGSLKVGGDEGRRQFISTLHPDGHMSHARYFRGAGVFFHDFKTQLPDYVHEAWEPNSDMEEAIDGEATVMVDHDLAMVWTPYWFRKNGELTHVGTNVFNLLKISTDGKEPGNGNWAWKIVVINDTAGPLTKEDRDRLDREYAKSKSLPRVAG